MCEFCKLIEQKDRFVCESDNSFCVISKSPVKEGHILVLPKKCVAGKDVHNLTCDESYDLTCLVQTMEDVLRKFSTNVLVIKDLDRLNHLNYNLIPVDDGVEDVFSKLGFYPKELDDDETLEFRDLIREKFQG